MNISQRILQAHCQSPTSQHASQFLHKCHQDNAPSQTKNDYEKHKKKEGRLQTECIKNSEFSAKIWV